MNGVGHKSKQLTNVEADIIRYLVWKVLVGDDDWFKDGLKELSSNVCRHEKSITGAITTLEAKGMIKTEKNGNKIWLKHTLTNDELYTRIAFIDPLLCNTKSMQELQVNLLREIERLEEEIRRTKEVNVRNQVKDKIIDLIIKQGANEETDELVDNFEKRTYSNINKSIDEIIEDALQTFRQEMFGKYDESIEEEKGEMGEKDVYDEFWSNKLRKEEM